MPIYRYEFISVLESSWLRLSLVDISVDLSNQIYCCHSRGTFLNVSICSKYRIPVAILIGLPALPYQRHKHIDMVAIGEFHTTNRTLVNETTSLYKATPIYILYI